MPQHDFEITNADAKGGLAFRAAVNAALQALATLSSGATEPTTPYAYQHWADTTTGLLKIRNAVNSAWIVHGPLAGIDEQRIMGRKTGGLTTGLTAAEIRTILGTAPFVLGSDADGDIYYRAASLLARLAKGAANTKMFMNAGATAPEWATGHNYLDIARNMATASGDVEYTGFNFKPNGILWVSCIDGAPSTFSIGISIGTYSRVILQAITTAPTTVIVIGASAIHIQTSTGNAQSAVVKSCDADGVTLTWTKYGSPTAIIQTIGLAFR